MGVPSLEPFIVPDISLNQTEPALQIDLETWNTSCSGGSQFDLRHLK